jgi:hypothetical protein
MGDQLTDLPDELLVRVFKMMPPEHRAKLRGVSQKFNAIICDVGYHLEPLFVDDKPGEYWPYYSAEQLL